MDSIKDLDIWRQIPPEEKLEIMSQSHAKGIVTCIMTLIVCGTLAIAIQVPWVLWVSILLTPFTFQLRTNLSWRSLNPSMVLKYLAARSVCRRYAYSAAHSKELDLEVIFPAVIWKDPTLELKENDADEADKGDKLIEEALKSFGKENISDKKIDVWVALFKDAVVFVKESPNGGQLMFASAINSRLKLHEKSDAENSEYDPNKELIIEQKKTNRKYFWNIKSKFPASLIVFEKMLSAKIAERLELEGVIE